MAERKPKPTPAAAAEDDTPQAAGQGGANDDQTSTPGDAVAAPLQPNAIEVVAKCESFRRAGRVFTRAASTIRLAELSEDEFKRLCHEPMLAVQLTHVAGED